MKRLTVFTLALLFAFAMFGCGGKKAPAEIAAEYVGRDVSALISEIGAPGESTYQDSCAKPGVQDGFLDYDGFTVVTEKAADGEIITRVEAAK